MIKNVKLGSSSIMIILTVVLMLSSCSHNNPVKVSTESEFRDAISNNKELILAEGYITTDDCVRMDNFISDVCFVSVKKRVQKYTDTEVSSVTYNVVPNNMNGFGNVDLGNGLALAPMYRSNTIYDWVSVGDEFFNSDAEFLGVPIGTEYSKFSSLYLKPYLPSLIGDDDSIIDGYLYEGPETREKYFVLINEYEKLQILFRNDNGDLFIEKIY